MLFSSLCPIYFHNHLAEEERAGRFTLNVFLLFCGCLCYVSLPCGAMGCKQENVEHDALNDWKTNIFKIIDIRISFYSRDTHLLPPDTIPCGILGQV